MTDRYAVFGNPVAHSRSPEIHAAFAQQTVQDLSYEKIEAPLDGFEKALYEFRSQGGKGCNITLPFKHDAYTACDELSKRAQRAGAVNTILFREGDRLFGDTVFGDNTDGIGLVRDLTHNLGISLAEKRILVLGASGAARGALQPLLDEEPSALFITNRTAVKAQELAQEFHDYPENKDTDLAGGGFADIPTEPFGVIINATSASVSGEVPDIPASVIGGQSCCYDMYYAQQATAFMVWAESNHASQIHDGLGMLVEQAAASFESWRGVRPDTGPVIKQFR